jgi:5'-deoxynucleotidase YfbR-like HD superfamily hydrolase
MKKIVSMLQVLDNLSRMPRTGGVMFAGIDSQITYSVADHSFMVVNLALLIGKAFQGNKKEISMDQVLTVAATHDWNESILLDIPSSSPSYRSFFNIVNLREIVKEAEANANQAIEEFLSEDAEVKINGTGLTAIEKDILKIADISALLVEVLNWKYRGLQYEWFDYMWENTIHRLQEVTNKYEFLSPFVDELNAAYSHGKKPINPFLTKSQFQRLKKES